MKKKIIELLAAVIAVGLIYRLHWYFIIILGVFTLFMMPKLIKTEKKRTFEKQRFEEAVTYMEQMMYSFKKQPKIREALQDTLKISDKNLADAVSKAIDFIDEGDSNDIYKDALQIIEEKYDCERIISLHKFIVKIEKFGGEYEKYVDILLDDLKGWNERTRLFSKDVDRVKKNVVISIGLTLLTCAFMLMLIPKGYTYVNYIIYQIGTVIALGALIAIYVVVNEKLCISWLKSTKSMDRETTIKYYKVIDKWNASHKHGYIEKQNYKAAKKRLEQEIVKEFPDWLRDTAINLQMGTVQSAIEASLEEAAWVLQPPIKNLLFDFEEYPVGIEPYDNFLKEFNLPEIKSSMKMFYCLNDLGKEEADLQVNSIIDRNNKLVDKAENMKNKETIGAASFLTAVPMFIGVIKIMLDMVLLIVVFTTSISGVLESGGNIL